MLMLKMHFTILWSIPANLPEQLLWQRHRGLGSDATRGVDLALGAVLVPRRNEVGEFLEADAPVVVQVYRLEDLRR